MESMAIVKLATHIEQFKPLFGSKDSRKIMKDIFSKYTLENIINDTKRIVVYEMIGG